MSPEISVHLGLRQVENLDVLVEGYRRIPPGDDPWPDLEGDAAGDGTVSW